MHIVQLHQIFSCYNPSQTLFTTYFRNLVTSFLMWSMVGISTAFAVSVDADVRVVFFTAASYFQWAKPLRVPSLLQLETQLCDGNKLLTIHHAI